MPNSKTTLKFSIAAFPLIFSVILSSVFSSATFAKTVVPAKPLPEGRYWESLDSLDKLQEVEAIIEDTKEEKTVAVTIPKSARFDLKDVEDDRYLLVGRLSLRRQFLGTRSTPQYQDIVAFHCFNGDELKFSSFTDPELKSDLSKRLTNGHELPAMLTVQFESKRVGHDGINMSVRLLAQIEACELFTAESICTAATEGAGFDAADSERFNAALQPDFEKDGIAVSLGNVSVRSKVTPRGSALSIHGIRVFNSTTKDAKIEIIGLTIEQDGKSQKCTLSERTRAPKSWNVAATTWSDGNYEKGSMPGTLWMFDRSGEIEPGKKVKVQLEIKLNGGDPILLTRIVDPT